jgi:alpha-mannosidase
VDRVPGEVPAQKWMDLTGKHFVGVGPASVPVMTGGDAGPTATGTEARPTTDQPVGASLLNDSKYGHNLNGSTMALTLLRSSYDPDPLPELGHHTIRFALVPHVGDWTASDSTRAGYEFNLPFNAVGTGMQEGKLPAKKTFGEILTPNVMLSGMKKAEDSSAVIVRLYEMEGRATTARMKLDEALVPATAQAVETDILEQPLAKNTAKFEKGTLSVKIAPFSMVTVRLK